jgi:hypothetical protein
MPATATNLYMDWSLCTITPAGGSAITLTGVTDASIDGRSVIETFYADAKKYPLCARGTQSQRAVKISCGNVKQVLMSVPESTPCTIVLTLNDAINGAGLGALTITAVNAMLETKGGQGAKNKFAMGALSFVCFGATGSGGVEVDPITIVEATS